MVVIVGGDCDCWYIVVVIVGGDVVNVVGDTRSAFVLSNNITVKI